MFAKSDVNGPNANEVYRYLRRNSSLHNKERDMTEVVPWNFAKFIVSSQFDDMQYFEPRHSGADIRKYIERLLAQ